MAYTIDFSEFMSKTVSIESRVEKELHAAMHDATDDLRDIARNIAPIDEGNLRKKIEKQVHKYPGKIQGTVYAKAVETSPGYGDFNYAIWTHEHMSNGQVRRGGPGKDGYSVGNKYLTRPLNGEANKYLKWFAEATKGGIDGK